MEENGTGPLSSDVEISVDKEFEDPDASQRTSDRQLFI